MARKMASLGVCVALLLMVVVAEAETILYKTKWVTCPDKKNYPACSQRYDLYCPTDCPNDCIVDCASCQPVCSLPPPPTPYVSPPPPPPPVVVPSPPPPSTPPPPPPSPTPSPPTLTPPSISSPPPPSPTPSPPTWTPPSTPTPSPPTWTPSSSGAPKKAKCKNKKYGKCYWTEHTCPSDCPEHCEVDCVTCSPVCKCNKPGAVCQDPRFIGADGLTFYFHGKKDKDFCIVSDSNLHINAHFIGKRNSNMKRDFTWVQSLGILFNNHQLYIGAEKTSTWDDSVDRLALKFNSESISLPANEGAKWQSKDAPTVSITRSSDTNAVVIEVEGNFQIKASVVPITEKDSKVHNYAISGEDCFAHLDLGFKFHSLSADVNGVLGQTYASNYESKVKMGVLMPVLGGEKEFASSDIFSVDCAAFRFNGRSTPSKNFEYSSLSCASGMDGKGVVCKR